tara:strand:- start:7 stop:417 length:411 start_codon:yes stop_codon:yes gene_type:complete
MKLDKATRNIIRIAHRGNTNGRIPPFENSPVYISKALDRGFHVEVDVWFVKNSFCLGHGEPRYPVDESFLETDNLICHAKNMEALHKMLQNEKIHCFWHEKDHCTITSRKWVWKFPEIYYDGEVIAICSDTAEKIY